jgi:molybdate transport system substrate-binding protein
MRERKSARTALATVGALVVLLGSAGAVATAADFKVLAGSAVTPVMPELVAAFEQASGHAVRSDFDGAIGAMTDRVLKGEAADVAIVSADQIELLEHQGRVVPGSRVDVARVGVGLFVRQGAAKPDIGSVEAFRAAMLAAKSIGYNDPAAGAPVGIYLLELFDRMGIAAEMKAKTVVFTRRTERFEAVARGDVEIGFNQISEILAAPGIDFAGPLPAPIQRYTLFASGIVVNGKEPEAGRAFVRSIVSPQARAVWKAKGFEAP